MMSDKPTKPKTTTTIRYHNPAPSRGGARPGAGRPRGQTSKITGATILASVEHYTGEKFEDLLAQGYRDAIMSEDRQQRIAYEKLFLSKVVADRVEMDWRDTTLDLDTKRAAFADALIRLGVVSDTTDPESPQADTK